MRKNSIIVVISLLLLLNCAFSWGLPSVTVPEPSVVYDINGQVINGLAQQNQINVSIDQISPLFIEAIIAVEDKNFYRHHGIDLRGVMRALWVNIKARKVVEGGSTITQQTAKQLFLSNERTLSRKLRELFYALELERKYSKDEIMALYCNTTYFGEGAYGIEVASRTYFAKSAHELNLAEAALLAGIPRSPTLYDPYTNPEHARQRQATVLKRMVEENKITATERDAALAQTIKYQRGRYTAGEAPYFIAMVRDYLIKKYGERMVFQGGLQVHTSLNLDMQKAANQAVYDGTKDRDPALQAALAAVDVKTGQIRALVGGRDYIKSPYNRALSLRQPGSTFKPFMYSLALEQGFTCASTMMCEKVSYKMADGSKYTPTDYGTEPYHWQEFTLKEAVMISDNIVAVQVNDILGPRNTADYCRKFGFNNIQPVLSLPLGSNDVRPLDLATGYAVFANQGLYNPSSYILKVLDNRGRLLEEAQISSQSVISRENAYLITDMLQGVLEPGGTGSRFKAVVQRPAAAKTGTTDEFRDAWFVGYTPRLSCAVWVGYDKEKNANLTGGAAAGPIWSSFIKEASRGLPAEDFPQPHNITMLNICLDSGQVACEACPRTMRMAFIKGTEPEDICNYHCLTLERWTDSLIDLFRH
ncbi:MAG TPA: penicillin-binding protein [Syntrophomonas sp.]|jgi:1A family penicillin-binding protein|nr:penicillin-binding protein [Syntrophomonas sp.]HCF70812.1 penicillin-binding protein [Syntrophomonas sp.]